MEASRKNSDAIMSRNNLQLHQEIEAIRDRQDDTIHRFVEAQRLAEQRRPLANGVTPEEIAAAAEHDIDLSVSLLVFSKAKKSLGQHVSLVRHALNPNNGNLFMRSCLNDLMSLRDQADHSVNGSSSVKGEIPNDIMGLLKGLLLHSRVFNKYLIGKLKILPNVS